MRHWLVYETNYFNRQLGRHYTRTIKVGPFSTPGSAKECWDNVISRHKDVHSPEIFYKECDL